MANAWSSRKYRTAWYLTTLTTTALLGPFVAGFFVSGACSELITGAQWLTFLFGIWGIYFGVNVMSKHHAFQKKQLPKTNKYKDPLMDDSNEEV